MGEKQSQCSKVLQHLKRFGSITSQDMAQKYFIYCPHSVIRDLRQTYIIVDKWEKNKNSGKHKRWFLQEA